MEMPTDQVRGLKAHGSSPAMTNKEAILLEWTPALDSKEETMAQHYDRKAEDLGNITMLEHVNLQIPDQAQGNLFYIGGLGLTRDPYMNTGLANMWINVGKSQFHLPTGDPWVLRGALVLVTPAPEPRL